MILRFKMLPWFDTGEYDHLISSLELYTPYLLHKNIEWLREKKMVFVIPLLGHGTAIPSVTPSAYVVIGMEKSGKMVCYRPDGKKMAYYRKKKGWKFLYDEGWIEYTGLICTNSILDANAFNIQKLPTAINGEITVNGNFGNIMIIHSYTEAWDPRLIRGPKATVYSSKLITSNYNGIILPEIPLRKHLEKCKSVEEVDIFHSGTYNSSFLLTLKSWFEKKIHIYKDSPRVHRLQEVENYDELLEMELI